MKCIEVIRDGYYSTMIIPFAGIDNLVVEIKKLKMDDVMTIKVINLYKKDFESLEDWVGWTQEEEG